MSGDDVPSDRAPKVVFFKRGGGRACRRRRAVGRARTAAAVVGPQPRPGTRAITFSFPSASATTAGPLRLFLCLITFSLPLLSPSLSRLRGLCLLAHQLTSSLPASPFLLIPRPFQPKSTFFFTNPGDHPKNTTVPAALHRQQRGRRRTHAGVKRWANERKKKQGGGPVGCVWFVLPAGDGVCALVRL